MKQIFKKILSELLYPTTGMISTKKVSVLMYHKVRIEHFERQIEMLTKHYNLITIDQLKHYLYNKKDLPRNSVHITFDDGYLNNYENAYPILKKYSVPATIFLATGFIGKKSLSWYDKIYYLAEQHSDIITYQQNTYDLSQLKDVEKILDVLKTMPPKKRDEAIKQMYLNKTIDKKKQLPKHFTFMNWKQIEEMKDIITYGSHTVNHHILNTLTKPQIRKELVGSKEYIRRRIEKRVLSIAYPNGNHNDMIQKMVEECGYKLAFTTNSGKIGRDNNPFALTRIPVNINDTYKLLAVKIAFTSILYPKGIFNKT